MGIDDDKFRKALESLAARFVSFLQLQMIESGFDVQERRVFHERFLNLMHKSLHEMAKRFDLHLKSKEKIKQHDTIENPTSDERLAFCIRLFNSRFPASLTCDMINGDFNETESSEQHEKYEIFYIKAFNTLVQMYHRYLLRSKGVLKKEAEKNITQKYSSFSHPPTESPKYDVISRKKKYTIYLISDSSQTYVMKVLNEKFSRKKFLARLENEFNIGKSIRHPALRAAHKLVRYQNKEAIILEWVKGKHVDAIKKLDVKNFLTIAREIVSVILELHNKQIIHLNLSFDHVLIDEETKSTKIIGYSSSSKSNYNHDLNSKSKFFQKNLKSVSPELARKVQSDIDYRSDLYSIGVIFHRLIHGDSSDNTFSFANDSESDIPKVILDMIAKLCSKFAEDRYQSAKGLMHDIDLMISEYKSDENLSSVILMQHDHPEMLLLPQKLYGRAKESNILNAVFEKMDTDSFEVVLLEGQSGEGKSSLVLEFTDFAMEKKAMILQGKYESAKDEPYYAIVKAIEGFCDELRYRSKCFQRKVKRRINEAVGDEGELLASMVKNFHLIIGNQRSLSQPFGKEAKIRFNYVLLKFLIALGTLGSPIILILEDLHWIDSHMLHFLSVNIFDRSLKNTLILCTYRKIEVNNTPPLSCLIESIQQQNINLTEIKLGKLSHETVNQFVSDTLRLPLFETYSLSTLLYQKTKGNPFFLKQMLNSLHEKQLLFFCRESHGWKWDISAFNEKELTEDVIEFLRMKISCFPKHTQNVFKVASCLGSPFPKAMLKVVLNNEKAIDEAIRCGMIVQNQGGKDSYRFAHDQIQLASYSLLPQQKNKILWHIGNKLLSQLPKEEISENIFVICNLFMKAQVAIDDFSRTPQIAVLFKLAGERAMYTGTFEEAFKYFSTGKDMIAKNAWKSNYKITLDLYCGVAKASYSIGNNIQMHKVIAEVFENTSCVLDLVQLYVLKVRLHNDMRFFDLALKDAGCYLEIIGEKLFDDANHDHLVQAKIVAVKRLVAEMSEAEILAKSEMTNESSLAVMMILVEIMTSAYFKNIRLLCLITARMIELTIEHGISKYSSCGFSVFGSILCNQCDDDGYALGKIAILLLKKSRAKEVLPKVYTTYYTLIYHRYEPIRASLDPLFTAFNVSLEVGCLEYCFMSAIIYCRNSFLSGRNLKILVNEIEDFVQSLSSYPLSPYFLSIHQGTLHLLGRDAQKLGTLNGEVFQISSLNHTDTKEFELVRAYLICGFISYLFYDYSSADGFLTKAEALHKHLLHEYHYPFFLFLQGLVSLANSSCNNSVTIAENNIILLNEFARTAPCNYENKVHILKTEIAMKKENLTNLERHLENAISLSEQNNFINEKAIICERLGIFYLNLDSTKAEKFLIASLHSYAAWGANQKVEHLRSSYPTILNHYKNNTEDCVSYFSSFEACNESSVSLLSTDITSQECFRNVNKLKRVRFHDSVQIPRKKLIF